MAIHPYNVTKAGAPRKYCLPVMLHSYCLSMFSNHSASTIRAIFPSLRWISLFVFVVTSVLPGLGQLPEQDCIGSIRLCNNSFTQNNAYVGYGSSQELIYQTNSTCIQSGETNSAWYMFTITGAGNLKFQINPHNPTDDFDFALYDISGSNCGNIVVGTAPEVRCNFSNTVGSTGLDNGFTGTSEASNGPNQCAPLAVTAGETYALSVNNFTATMSGYDVTFSGSASILDGVAPQLDTITFSGCNPDLITIHFTEKLLCNSVATDGSDFTVSGPGPLNVIAASPAGCKNSTATSKVFLRFDTRPPVVGTYTITAQTGTDGNTIHDICSNSLSAGATLSFTVNFLGPDVSIPTFTDSDCGAATGTASAGVTGGTSPFTYSWSDGQTGPTATGLSAGIFEVTVTDDNGCTDITNVTIGNLNSPLATSTHNDVSCNGGSDGSISVTVTGGAPPYTYSWLSGQTTANISGLSAGTYSCGIWDQNLCGTSEVVTIKEPDPLVLTVTTYDASCNGSDGGAKVTVTGGTTPYNYSWNTFPPAITDSIGGVPAGIYSVQVTDDNSCAASKSAFIVTSNAPTAIISHSQDATCGNADGTATVRPSGGTPPYTFEWSTIPVQTDSTAVNLLSGFYNVIIRDASNCIEIVSVKINEFPAPQIAVTDSTDASCGNPDGTATAAAISGTGSYTFSWSSGSIGAQATGLDQGTYTVVVTDSLGCKDTAQVSIDYLPPTSSIDVATTCINMPVDFSVTSDMNPTSWSWTFDDPASGSDDSASIADPMHTFNSVGSYDVTVYLDGNCGKDTAVRTITIDPALQADFTTAPDEVTQNTNITFNYTGDPVTSYLWDFGDGTLTSTSAKPVHLYKDSGTVSVVLMVESAAGCQDTLTKEILVLKYPIIYIPNAFSPNGDGVNDNFLVKGRGIKEVNFRVFNKWGEMVFFTNDVDFAKTTGWDGTRRGKVIQPGVYVYYISGVYFDELTFDQKGAVTLVR